MRLAMNPRTRLYLQIAGLGCFGYAGYLGYTFLDTRREIEQMYQYTSQDLLELGEKLVRDFETQGYSQIPIAHTMGLRFRDAYWTFRHFLEFAAEKHNLTEVVFDRISCYHLEPPKDGSADKDYNPWHFDGGPGPKSNPKLDHDMHVLHQDMTFLGNKVMAALAAHFKDKTLAAIATDEQKRSECIWKYYPEETPIRPANCGQYGLFYLLPSTTMMDSPLCRRTFEVYDPKRKRYIDLEETAPHLVSVTIVPAIPLLKYTKSFAPCPWRVSADRKFSRDGRKTIEYAYATTTTVPPRFELTPAESKYFGVQDGFRYRRAVFE